MIMFTITDIVSDIDRGCAVHNLNEDKFSYRVIFYINENGMGTRCHIDTSYEGLRADLENIIRENLTLTNTVSVAQTTVLKDGKCIRLQSRPYAFSLEEYFCQIYGKGRKRNITHGRYALNAT